MSDIDIDKKIKKFAQRKISNGSFVTPGRYILIQLCTVMQVCPYGI
jgi:hypothetical protein